MNQTEFGNAIGVHKNSVINWERGVNTPNRSQRILLRNLMRRHGLTNRTRGPAPLNYDPVKREMYMGRPIDAGRHWTRMSRAERRSWWGHRAKYRSLDADIQAGRVFAQPVVSLLDDAPDLDRP